MELERVRKSGVALSGLAAVLFGLAVVGVDGMLLQPKVAKASVVAPFEDAALSSIGIAKGVASWTLEPFDGRFVLPERLTWDSSAVAGDGRGNAKEAADLNSSELEAIRVTGILRGRDGLEALVNRSRIREGGAVLGYTLVSLTEEIATFDVNGKMRELRINEEMTVPKKASVPLTLDAVRERAGAWEAVINGQPYKAGDWVDPDTQVRMVMPGKVMVFRGGTLKTLTPEK
jgi:hypothetical protein